MLNCIAQYAFFSLLEKIHRSDINSLVFNEFLLVKKIGRMTGDTIGNITR